MQQISWSVKKMKVADLKDLQDNPRKITKEAFEKLKERFASSRGFHNVLKIDTNNEILSGNQSRRALKELKVLEVNVLVPDRKLTKEEKDAVILESNRHEGTWDFDMLANNFETDFLTGIGFTLGELGIGDNFGKNQIDVDNMASGLESYMNSDIKQIVLYFKGDEYGDIITRLDRILPKTGATNYSELLLQLLKEHEENK